MARFIIIIIVSLLALFKVQAKEADCILSVRIESDHDNNFFTSYNENKLFLRSYALLKALIAKTSCSLEPLPLPNGRAVMMLENGSLAIMMGLSKTSERAQFSYFLGPHHTEKIVVVGHKNLQNKVTNLSDILALKGLISVTNGAYYGAEWESALQDHMALKQRIVQLSENQQKFSMLTKERVDVTLEDERVADELLKEDSFKNHYAKLFTLHENFVYFAFSKKRISEKLYNELIQEWQKMLASGEVYSIQQQYRY